MPLALYQYILMWLREKLLTLTVDYAIQNTHSNYYCFNIDEWKEIRITFQFLNFIIYFITVGGKKKERKRDKGGWIRLNQKKKKNQP